MTEILASADLSADRLYRYSLTRFWPGGGGVVNWIMLNPSTADETENDPTVRRCMGFAEGWGYSGIVVTNLFAWRSSDPMALRRAKDPVGERNDDAIMEQARCADLVVCAWGNHGSIRSRDNEVRGLLHRMNKVAQCFGRTTSGQPKHPLYLRADSELVRL